MCFMQEVFFFIFDMIILIGTLMRPLFPDIFLFRSLLLNEKNILNGKK